MEDETKTTDTETPTTAGAGDTDVKQSENVQGETITDTSVAEKDGETGNVASDIEKDDGKTEKRESEIHKADGDTENDGSEGEKVVDEGEKTEGEESAVDHAEIGSERSVNMQGEHIEGEHMEGEYVEGENIDGEHLEEEQADKLLGEGEELMGEHMEGEQMEGEHEEGEKAEEPKPTEEEIVEEEQKYVEEPPPDPAEPYNFSDSKEALREPFELRPDQLMEVELLWAEFQNYTPAYTELDNYITEKELVYMLKALLLMTYTPEQLIELIEYCVRPPHPEGHITYEQFLKMVIMRQRDFAIEEELRAALQVYDPDKTGLVDREYLREMLSKHGHKMPQRQLEHLIKEVDLSNDGTLGIEDIIGTMCIDLNKEDIQMLRDALNPNAAVPPSQDEEIGEVED